jgi:hypothetical protein
MAIRSVSFIKDNQVVREDFEIKWVSGLSLSQKQKNIEIFHRAISERFSVELDRILEVSTKSKTEIGRLLSSFNLKFKMNDSEYAFESVYQSSKVFQDGLFDTHQYNEWLALNGYDAKKRSQKIKLPLAEFRFNQRSFSLEPKTLFFDWLYIGCIEQYNLGFLLKQYNYFTDIEFNPVKMVSTQANALCKYKWLVDHNLVEEYLQDPIKFYKGEN